MAQIGIVVFAVGASLIAVGIAVPRSINIALGAGGHATLFVSGLGLLVAVSGLCLTAIAGLRRLLGV